MQYPELSIPGIHLFRPLPWDVNEAPLRPCHHRKNYSTSKITKSNQSLPDHNLLFFSLLFWPLTFISPWISFLPPFHWSLHILCISYLPAIFIFFPFQIRFQGVWLHFGSQYLLKKWIPVTVIPFSSYIQSITKFYSANFIHIHLRWAVITSYPD